MPPFVPSAPTTPLAARPMTALTPGQYAALTRLRDEIVAAGETNSAGGPSCGVLSEEAGPLVGGTEFYGAYACDDGTAPEHAWVVLPDGTIVDASADQFGGPPIVVVPPGDPRAARYLDQDGDDCTYGLRDWRGLHPPR